MDESQNIRGIDFETDAPCVIKEPNAVSATLASEQGGGLWLCRPPGRLRHGLVRTGLRGTDGYEEKRSQFSCHPPSQIRIRIASTLNPVSMSGSHEHVNQSHFPERRFGIGSSLASNGHNVATSAIMRYRKKSALCGVDAVNGTLSRTVKRQVQREQKSVRMPCDARRTRSLAATTYYYRTFSSRLDALLLRLRNPRLTSRCHAINESKAAPFERARNQVP